MTNPDPSPKWNLLPHSPQEFFGLSDEFDRKDLKRSYNCLIRIYKPEKFPQEFQRIREAYEQLDNQLRYGVRFFQGIETSDSYEWRTESLLDEQEEGLPRDNKGSSAPQPPESERPRRHAGRLPLHERIQCELPADVYRSLAKKEDKTAYDYYALALMSDIVHRKDGLQFARWILAGVKAYPEEQGLNSLLYEYYRGPIQDSVIPNLLVVSSQILAKDRFFSMTESLWFDMLRVHSFQKFRATLEQCEANLQGIDIDGQLAFLIEILKAAIWKADDEWTEKTMTLIDENFEHIPFHLQYDVDILEHLKKYMDQRDAFLTEHPLRQKIDRAMESYFSENQLAGDQSVLECHVEIAQNPASLLEAFPHGDGECGPLFLVWTTINEDVAERYVVSPKEEQDPSIWALQVLSLLQRIDAVTNSSPLGIRWSVVSSVYFVTIGIVYFSAVLLLTVLLMVLTFSIASDVVIPSILLVSIVGGLWAANRLHERVLFKYWNRYSKKKLAQFYRTLWRQEILAFMERSHLNYFELQELFYSCNVAGLLFAERAIECYQQDYALALYSEAQRFVI